MCNAIVPAHGHYLVRIEVLADPSLPDMSTDDIEEADFDSTFSALMQQMKHMTAEDLSDQVYKRFEFKICHACQRKFLANPLGMPRRASPGEN